MILKVIIGDQIVDVEVPESVVGATEFFSTIDADMDKGKQMGRSWIASPDNLQRCQFVADRMLTAIHNEDPPMRALMAGYLLSRMPGINSVNVAIDGEIQETTFS